MRLAVVLIFAVTAASCGGVQHFQADAYPAQLSAWGLFEKSGSALRPHADTHVYNINTPLFSDYALKLRTVHLPDGTQVSYDAYEAFDFPVGSIVTKTFFYAADGEVSSSSDGFTEVNLSEYTLVETRLLVKQSGGWDALPYVWQGDDAYLDLTGELIPMELGDQRFAYHVPSKNECGGCHITNHTSGELRPIGLKARHIPAIEQQRWADAGLLVGTPETFPQNARFSDAQAPVEHRARSYLDANCGHCHNAAGAADTSGLLLDYADLSLRQMGLCKPPIAAGRGSGGRRYSIVPGQPDASILTYRMETNDPGRRMPEIGRAIAHTEGIQLIENWIAQLPGEC